MNDPSRTTDPSGRPLLDREILVIDDCVQTRQLLTHVLSRAGGRVTTCHDGFKGVAVVTSEAEGTDVDIVLCDYEMDGIDGIETTRRLRAGGFEGPVIAMSAVTTADNLNDWLDAGCDTFFMKPFSAAQVLDAVGRGVETAYARRAELNPCG
ncbi:MAG: response regulator [Planctomycetota bacterium]